MQEQQSNTVQVFICAIITWGMNEPGDNSLCWTSNWINNKYSKPLPFSVNVFTQQMCSETPKFNNDLQRKSTQKGAPLHYEKNKEMSFSRYWFLIICVTEIRLTHPSVFTFPSCVWTFWSTGFSLCPGCLCSICNVTNIHIHQHLQWFVIGVHGCVDSLRCYFPQQVVNVTVKGPFCLSTYEALLGVLVLLQLHVSLAQMTIGLITALHSLVYQRKGLF